MKRLSPWPHKHFAIARFALPFLGRVVLGHDLDHGYGLRCRSSLGLEEGKGYGFVEGLAQQNVDHPG